MKYRNVAMPALGILFCALGGFAQTSSIEGDVKAADGSPLKGGLIKIEREDIKGHYQVKTDKKGHYYYGGLPLGMYKVTLEVDGKDIDFVDKVKTRLGDPVETSFDEHAAAQKQQALNKAAETGTLSKDQARGMTPEEKAAFEKANKERADMKAKGKALNDAFNAGKEALNAKQFDVAVTQFSKASEMAPDQPVIWANLGDADIALAKTKTGAEHDDALNKGLEAYKKTLELKPDDAGVHNNYALALAQAKKFDDAEAELAKAAQIDPPSAGKYYYNLGALLVNNGQAEPAGEAFKKAIDADPKYADAQYQYGVVLMAKAQVGADGKVTPLPGTADAFKKYLELVQDRKDCADAGATPPQPGQPPCAQFKHTAEAMLTSLGSSLDTSYQNPTAKKKTTKKN